MKHRAWLLLQMACLVFPTSVDAVLILGTPQAVFGNGFESPAAPEVALNAVPIVVHRGQTTRLTWTTSAAHSCIASATPAVAAWSGTRTLQGTMDVVVSTSTYGTYQLMLTCANEHGTTIRAIFVSVVSDPLPQSHCEEYVQSTHGGVVPQDPAFTAFGFEQVVVPFQQVFGVPPGMPSSGFTPLPAAYLNPSRHRYLAIPFSLSLMANMTMQWTDFGIAPHLSGPLRVTVSPCPGDFRARQQPDSPDPYLRPACRNLSATYSGQMIIANPGVSQIRCHVPIDKTMYINIATHTMMSPAGGAYTCPESATTCAMGMRMQ